MRLHAEGAPERTPCFEVRSAVSRETCARVAIVVPRYGNTAVARNRVKRRLRELVRRDLLPGLAPRDVLVRATRASYRVSFEAMRAAMQQVAQRLVTKP